MRRKLLMGAALCLAALLFLRPAAVSAQGKGPEIIRGTKKVPAVSPAQPQTLPPAEPGAKPAAPPAPSDLAYQQGMKFLGAGDYDQAIKAFQQALTANPRSAATYYSLGLAYSAQGNQDKAVKNLMTALRLKPNFPQAHISLGQIYAQQGLNLLRQGHPERATAALKDAVAQDPKNDGAFNNLGVALAQQGNYTQSLAALQRAVALNPNNNQAQFNLGVTQYSLGNKNATVQQYTILTLTDPPAADELFRIIQGTSEVATPFRF
jgi:tetratricopeptide (TPR) repeat protein